MAPGVAAVFLDRDGTILVDVGYPKDPALTTLLPGAGAALRALRAQGYKLVVISNQSGVGRGLLTEADVWRVHRRMEELLQPFGVALDRAYYCFHGPDDGCACRKPSPEMIERAARELGIDLTASVVVGDKASDVDGGLAAGCAAILLGDRDPGAAGERAASWEQVLAILARGVRRDAAC